MPTPLAVRNYHVQKFYEVAWRKIQAPAAVLLIQVFLYWGRRREEDKSENLAAS